MKKIAFIFLLITTGCHDQIVGSPQGNMDKGRMVCRDGVEYLQFNNIYGDSFTVHMRPNGRPYTC